MMAEVTTLTEEEFDERFTHVVREDGSIAWDTVEDIKDVYPRVTAKQLWTFVDGDDGTTYLISGVHFVNAFAYSMTNEEHDFDVQLRLDGPDS